MTQWMPKRWIVWVMMGCMLMMMAAACDDDNGGGGGPVSSPCNCDDIQVIQENGLALTFESQSVARPANVSVLFQVETVGGEPVTGLTANDLAIFEDGERISAYESRQALVSKPGKFRSHAMLLLDLSGSIVASENLALLKEAAKRFVFSVMLDPTSGIDIGIWWFDGARQIHPLVDPFTSDTAYVLSRIDRISSDMSNDLSTNLYGATIAGVQKIESMVGTFGETTAVGSLVIFTDGTDQAAWRSREDAFEAVEDADPRVSVYTIGLAGEIDEAVLSAIGKDGSPLADDVEALVPRFEEIADWIRRDANSHYLLEYCSPKRRGEHELRVEVVQGELSGSLSTCFCAEGFTGGCTVSPYTL